MCHHVSFIFVIPRLNVWFLLPTEKKDIHIQISKHMYVTFMGDTADHPAWIDTLRTTYNGTEALINLIK